MGWRVGGGIVLDREGRREMGAGVEGGGGLKEKQKESNQKQNQSTRSCTNTDQTHTHLTETSLGDTDLTEGPHVLLHNRPAHSVCDIL